MLRVTPEACEHISNLMKEAKAVQEVAPGLFPRLLPSITGIEIRFDHMDNDDSSFSHEDEVVLVADSQVMELLEHQVLDVDFHDEQIGLILRKEDD